MTRHNVKRDLRGEANQEMTRLEAQMRTYEEMARKKSPREKKFNFWRFFEFPWPNKIKEMDSIQARMFADARSAFFIPRPLPGEAEEEEDESPRGGSPNSERSGNTEGTASSESSAESNPTEEQRLERDWNLMSCCWTCLRQLFFSRVWIFFLQFIASYLAGDRFRTDAFHLTDMAATPGKSAFGDIVVRKGLAGLRRWDAQHFLFIADNNYILEPSLCFFPGYPEVVSLGKLLVHQYMITNYNWLFPSWVVVGVMSVIVNLFFFHLAGLSLFVIVLTMTRSVKQGLLATSIFAYNPASIFFSSAYSESMFFTMSITGLSFMISANRSILFQQRIMYALTGTILLGISPIVRSNGLLNVLFLAWYWCGTLLWAPEKTIPECRLMIDFLAGLKNDRMRQDNQSRLRDFEKKRKFQRKVFRWTDPGYSKGPLVFFVLVFICITLIVFLAPYVFMVNGAHHEFCNASEDNKMVAGNLTKRFILSKKMVTVLDAKQRATWCRDKKVFGIVHDYYSKIQAKYWDVGFLGYWRIRKIPCFLMMMPAAFLTVLACQWAFKDVFENKGWNNIWVLATRSDHFLHCAIHAAFLLCFALFFINVEVFTRLIFSSNVLLYVFVAQYIDKLTATNTFGNRLWHYTSSPGILPFFVFRRVWEDGWRGKALYIYFFGYFIFGTMAHAAWLPFT